MAKEHKLPKFNDARGWSLMDIYRIAATDIKKSGTDARTPYDKSYDYGDIQINYSVLYPGIVKAWHRHENQDDYFCVIHGDAQVGVYSDEEGAEKFFIGEHNPALVHIKAGEWHGLTAVGTKPVGLLYLVTNKYDARRPDEERAPHDNFVDSSWWLPENK